MVFRRQINRLTFLFFSVFILFSDSRLSAHESKIHEGPCIIKAGNHTVTLNIDPKPVKAMKELSFSLMVTPCDKLPDKLLIDLSMPGMQMGKNQITLIKKNTCLYEGKGIVVRCMSRLTLWQVTILSDELNNPAFTFNVRE